MVSESIRLDEITKGEYVDGKEKKSEEKRAIESNDSNAVKPKRFLFYNGAPINVY